MSSERSTPPIFTGLSAFPLTPASLDGVVDTARLGLLLDRICGAGVGSIGLLGSTGAYAYLDRPQRQRAVEAAVEAVAGRAGLFVGVGALRTDWAEELAKGAERARADGLLLAPMSYTPLTTARSSSTTARSRERPAFRSVSTTTPAPRTSRSRSTSWPRSPTRLGSRR